MALTVTFDLVIKPYFTPCYRAHMIKFGPRIDLWDYDVVKQNWQLIHDAVIPPGNFMPRKGCPEGVWDDDTRNQFITDFIVWKNGGYQR